MKLQFIGKEPREIYGGYDSHQLKYGEVIEFSDFLYHLESKDHAVYILIEANSDGWAVEYDLKYDTKEEMFSDWEVVEATLEEISNFIANSVNSNLCRRVN